MIITIGGDAVKIRSESFFADDSTGDRSTCSFVVVDKAGTAHYDEGMPVEISNGDIIFAGYVDKSVEKQYAGSTITYHTVTCKDMHYLADKRVIAKAFTNATAGSIVTAIIEEYLADEGVTVGIIQDGPVVLEAIFNYIYSTRAFEALAEKADFVWYIDYDKKFYFMDRGTITAPWSLTAADIQADTLTIENGNPKYRNKQYIKGGKDITDPLTEIRKGDGVTRTWVVGFPIAKEPSISLNGTPFAANEIGIRGVEENKKFYWSKGENTVTQDENETILTDTDTLTITYQGEYDMVVISGDQGEIESRAAMEGSSGIVEDVVDEVDNSSRDAAFQSANAKIKQYAVRGRRVKYTTKRPGLFAGQIQTVNLAALTGDLLIESVFISLQSGVFIYNVTAVEGPEVGSWTRMFKAMAAKGQAVVIRENISEKQVLVSLAQFSKTWEEGDSPNIFKEIYASETLFPSSTLLPMFAPADRVKYIELLNGSNHLLVRKHVTKQTGNLISTFYIVPYEAIGTIATIKLYGGTKATNTPGSGVLLDTIAYSKVKTEIESIQIEKTDIRDFTPMTGSKALTVAYWQGIDEAVEAYLTHSI